MERNGAGRLTLGRARHQHTGNLRARRPVAVESPNADQDGVREAAGKAIFFSPQASGAVPISAWSESQALLRRYSALFAVALNCRSRYRSQLERGRSGALGVGLHGPHLHDLLAPEARQHRPPAPARRHAEQHRASLRRVRSGPFEPFTLVHVGSYAADIQHSGEAIADHLKSSFAIICFNSRTYESGGIMAVVKAHAAAEHLLRDYEFGQSEQDRHNGWRYFLEETDLVPGMNPDEATKLRQARLERRESGFLNNPCSR